MTNARITPALFTFLSELRAHNDRAWFKANQARFERDVRDPLLALIETITPALAKLDPPLVANASKVGGSLFRIQRDTRFSKDKTPYKDWMGMRFHTRDAAPTGETVGCFLSLSPEGGVFAAGLHGPSTAALNLVRQRIVDEPDAWQRLIDQGFTMHAEEGDVLKTVPRGFDKDAPHVEDLRKKHLYTVERLAKKELTDARFPSLLVERCERAQALNRWIGDAIGIA